MEGLGRPQNGASPEVEVPPVLPKFRIVIAALSATMLAACASVQVRSVATNTGDLAFDLTGTSIAALTEQATRLCPQGYAVMRQWQRSNAPTGSADAPPNWVLSTGLLSYDLQPDQAQMSVVCRA
jgi:hypothetical protein